MTLSSKRSRRQWRGQWITVTRRFIDRFGRFLLRDYEHWLIWQKIDSFIESIWLVRLLEPLLGGSVDGNRRWVDAASMMDGLRWNDGVLTLFEVGLKFPQGIWKQLQVLRTSALVGEYWKRCGAAIARLRRHCRTSKRLIKVFYNVTMLQIMAKVCVEIFAWFGELKIFM